MTPYLSDKAMINVFMYLLSESNNSKKNLRELHKGGSDDRTWETGFEEKYAMFCVMSFQHLLLGKCFCQRLIFQLFFIELTEWAIFRFSVPKDASLVAYNFGSRFHLPTDQQKENRRNTLLPFQIKFLRYTHFSVNLFEIKIIIKSEIINSKV